MESGALLGHRYSDSDGGCSGALLFALLLVLVYRDGAEGDGRRLMRRDGHGLAMPER